VPGRVYAVALALLRRALPLPHPEYPPLDAIRKTAAANGGIPLGFKRFAQETGIGYSDWHGKFWGRWGDALQEAGFSPNTLQPAFSDDDILQRLISLTREIKRFPGTGDMRLKKRNDPSFPNEKVFDVHFGPRAQQRRALLEYCRTHPGYEDIPPLLAVFTDDDEQLRTHKAARPHNLQPSVPKQRERLETKCSN